MTRGTAAAPGEERVDAFTHPAFFYHGEDGFLAGVGAFVRAGLENGEPILVVLPESRERLLREDLGALAREVTWPVTGVFGPNPGRAMSAFREFVDRHPNGHPRVVGEPVWPGRDTEEVREVLRHEMLFNLALAGSSASVLCPYDVSSVPSGVLEEARRSHPTMLENEGQRPSPWYTGRRERDVPLTEPPTRAVSLPYDEETLSAVRGSAERWAREAGLSGARRTDLVLAIAEATTNSVRHGGGTGVLRLWVDGSRARAETRDAGRLSDPLAGTHRPDPFSASGGRGLWMINRLCDLVQMRSLPDGLVIRMTMTLDSPGVPPPPRWG
ncbi:sensor histidine kinase [Streptomyces alkaliphilus]|uniref:Sensor histidine kinase n=1 Tax=Streptomyces alkaliphilus TaxID=1472722 RepID=A0A7W3Y1A9_9ACTN|nr:sensor histidine kinase [Streptomyces alkaliphilus]MBB0244479.1 sensor histidine kinase [Streptomyces alkaliphilus]